MEKEREGEQPATSSPWESTWNKRNGEGDVGSEEVRASAKRMVG